MHLTKTQSTCGRLAQKPEQTVKVEVANDDAVPIQDQIESLRTKITLKERYNRVLRDELQESRQGAATVLQDLYRETEELRHKLIDAVDSEKFAVQNALRTHRAFQMAMFDKTPGVAIEWLEDKLFDNSKKMNSLLDRLHEKRCKLDEAEHMVMVIEKWPRPGTRPWELAANLNLIRIDNMVEAVNVKRETAQIMNSKYRDIKMTLIEERGKYGPNLKNLETQLNFHRAELANLEKMQEDAAKFREDAAKNLLLTEKEASDNRKKRRKQMSKMKRAVQKVMEENQVKNKQPVKSVVMFGQSTNEKVQDTDINERINAKHAEVEKYQDRARRLVDTMRVPDLTHIPNRLVTVIALGARLNDEIDAKEQLRDLLIRQRDQLQLILCHYKYSGQIQQSQYLTSMKAYDQETEEMKHSMELKQANLTNYGDIITSIRLGVIALMERLDENKIHHTGHSVKQAKLGLKAQIRILNNKCRRLLTNLEAVRSLFPEESDKNYASYIKIAPTPNRLVRVGSPVVSEGSDEEEYADFKVPGRNEIKIRSAKFIQQALIRRGLH